MSLLSDVAASPMLKEYAQGAAQDAVQPVADFIAPTVNVAAPVGRFKKYTERDRFRLPETRRAIGGRATTLQFEATDGTYQCQPNALDYPVDVQEELAAGDVENMLMEGAVSVAEVGGLVHEKRVIDAAIAAAGAGTNVSVGGVDAVDQIDNALLGVLKAAKYGSLMGVGVLFGATAFKLFKNSASVKARFVTSGSGKKGDLSTGTLASVTPDLASSLFLGQPETRVSYMVYDASAEGTAENMQFILDTSVLIFARKQNPTRRDPSFMKTFRLMGKWMVPGSYQRDDQRVEVAKFDWSEDVQVTNSTAVKRLVLAA
jgi:hypothetical protein